MTKVATATRIGGNRMIWRPRRSATTARSFDALPRGAWLALGIVELVCAVGLRLVAAAAKCIATATQGRAGEVHAIGRSGS
jgi:hypothetical protein